jgi:PAS domain S-box-containing protein
MGSDEKETRELRRLLRDLVALATTPAVWVGRGEAQIAEGVADVLLHILRADAVYVGLQSPKVDAFRSPQHPGFSDEVRRLWPQSALAGLQIDTIAAPTWPSALRVAMQPIGMAGDYGFIVVGCAGSGFPNESHGLLLSVAANQAAVALQAARLRIQAELERHRLQDLLAKAPAAIGLLSGPEHRWAFVNENYIRVTGRTSATDFVGKTLRESLPEIEGQLFIQLMDGVYRTGNRYVGREMKAKLNRAYSGQPEEGYFDFVYEPLRNADGVVDGIFVHAVEVTDKVMARQEVEKRERQFREMIDALPAAIYTTDAEGRLTHFNPAAVEFSGRTPELGTDRWCVSWKLYYADGRPMPYEECPMAIALKQGRVIKGAEAIAECPDGTQRWFIPHPTLLRDDQGKIVGGINMLVDITARKHAEEATAYLAAIVSSSDDAILSKNLDGVIRSWNKSAERLFGYTAKEAIGKHITIIVPSDRRTEEDNILSRLRRGERIDHFETVRMRKDGTTFDVSLTISPVKDSAGRVIGASNVARDISHLKRIERALRDSEERFRAIVDTTPECVKLVAQDGTLLHMNSSGLAMVGAESPTQVVGKSIYELIAPKDRERFRALNQSVCGGNKGALTFDIVRLDGEYRHMETQAAPLRNPDGTVVQLAVTRDITERKRAQERLRESEERLRALVKASSYIVYRMSPDWSEMRQLDGLGFISDTPKPTKDWLQQYIYPDDQSVVLETIAKAIESKSVFELEHRVLRVDGSLGWTVSRAVPLLDKDGEITEWFGAATDVTARKVAEESYRKLAETLDAEVRARTRELEERNSEILRQSEQVRELSWRLLRAQDEERRHIARELHDSAGQTLTVLGMNLAQFVQKTGRAAPEVAGEAETIQEMVQQLHRDIRTTSYLLHPPLLDESGLYSALSWYTQGLVERSGLQIRLDMAEDFGRLSGDMELVVFRLIQECLTNIHRHARSKTASIRIARNAGQVTVEVRDQGSGMSPERLAQIQSGASGVGIRGIRERLRQFKGEMEIHSDISGTRILVTIPVPKNAVSEDESSPESLQAAI